MYKHDATCAIDEFGRVVLHHISEKKRSIHEVIATLYVQHCAIEKHFIYRLYYKVYDQNELGEAL